MRRNSGVATCLLAVAGAVQAGSLQDIKHIVLFMQENRAFDHVSRTTSFYLPFLFGPALASETLFSSFYIGLDEVTN